MDRRADVLIHFCACLSDRDGVPTATAACAASYGGTKTMGPFVSTRDAAFRSLSLATILAIPALHELIQHIKIYTTDPLLLSECLDQAPRIEPDGQHHRIRTSPDQHP